MVEDLNLDVEIIGAETTREFSGLATSSRNQYLSDEQKLDAAIIFETLKSSAERIQAGERDYALIEQQAIEVLQKAGMSADYYRICNADTLKPAASNDRKLVVLVTAKMGETRLLDNIEIDLW